jgi:hypothetical protein
MRPHHSQASNSYILTLFTAMSFHPILCRFWSSLHFLAHFSHLSLEILYLHIRDIDRLLQVCLTVDTDLRRLCEILPLLS